MFQWKSVSSSEMSLFPQKGLDTKRVDLSIYIVFQVIVENIMSKTRSYGIQF